MEETEIVIQQAEVNRYVTEIKDIDSDMQRVVDGYNIDNLSENDIANYKRIINTIMVRRIKADTKIFNVILKSIPDNIIKELFGITSDETPAQIKERLKIDVEDIKGFEEMSSESSNSVKNAIDTILGKQPMTDISAALIKLSNLLKAVNSRMSMDEEYIRNTPAVGGAYFRN